MSDWTGEDALAFARRWARATSEEHLLDMIPIAALDLLIAAYNQGREDERKDK